MHEETSGLKRGKPRWKFSSTFSLICSLSKLLTVRIRWTLGRDTSDVVALVYFSSSVASSQPQLDFVCSYTSEIRVSEPSDENTLFRYADYEREREREGEEREREREREQILHRTLSIRGCVYIYMYSKMFFLLKLFTAMRLISIPKRAYMW